MDKTEREQYLITLRRQRLQALLASGMTQTAAAVELSVSEATITSDCQYLKRHAQDYIHSFDEHFAQKYMEVLDMVDMILLESWRAVKASKYERWKAPLLSVALQTLLAKASLISDVGLIDRVSSYLKDIQKRKKHLIGLEQDPQLEQLVTSTGTTTTMSEEQEEDTMTVRATDNNEDSNGSSTDSIGSEEDDPNEIDQQEADN
jgi:hypothetical protein